MDLHQTFDANCQDLLLVGGMDPGAGAGVLRDFLTAVELGAWPTVVVTSITEQDSTAVTSIEPREPARVAGAIAAGLARMRTPAVKIGMVANAAVAHSVTEALARFTGPVVYDPVLRASSGGSLYEGDRDAILELARHASLLTPNLGEAAWLLDRPLQGLVDAQAAAHDLGRLGIPAVLLKGGHLAGDATDVLVRGKSERLFTHARISGPSPRGTGCALATAIAVGLGRGQDLEAAVGSAKTWLTSKIARATRVGREWHL
jgi:hydroxymethylpyrimidine/phosphomethylpyrimidine kinase